MRIKGNEYLKATEIALLLDISRQTLWRWRKEGKVPAGIFYRDKTVIFTYEEYQQIKEYSERMKS